MKFKLFSIRSVAALFMISILGVGCAASHEAEQVRFRGRSYDANQCRQESGIVFLMGSYEPFSKKRANKEISLTVSKTPNGDKGHHVSVLYVRTDSKGEIVDRDELEFYQHDAVTEDGMLSVESDNLHVLHNLKDCKQE